MVKKPNLVAKRDLLKSVAQSLRDGSLELPSLPDVALDVRAVASKPETGISDLVKLVRNDPGLSAYLLKVANSALFSTAHPARDLNGALARLGVDAARDLASSYAIRTLFFLRGRELKRWLQDVWRRSVYTSALSSVLARHCGFDPDHALLAGLIQDIGALPLLARLKHFPDLLEDDAVVRDLLDNYTGKISGLILNTWKFEQDLVVVGLERENWLRDKQPKADLADLVLVARYHTYIGEPVGRTLPPLAELPAVRKLKLGELSEEEGLALLKAADEEVQELRQVLH